MKVLDPGHCYQLLCLDGDYEQILQFVKREGPGYPGNVGTSAGTNLQSVLRACIDRVRYLQQQIPCAENVVIDDLLTRAVHLLEERAAVRHGRSYPHSDIFACSAPLCPQCGHTDCEHGGRNR